MLSKKSDSKNQNFKQRNFFHQLPLLMFHPTQFFQSIEKDTNANRAVKWSFLALFFVSIVVVGFAFMIQRGLDSFSKNSPIAGEPFSFFWAAVAGQALMFFILIMSVLFIPLTHFFVKKFGGKQPWQETVKATFYPLTGWFIFQNIPIVSIFAGLWAIYAMYRGFRVLQRMPQDQVILFFVVSSIVEMVILAIIGTILYVILSQLILI